MSDTRHVSDSQPPTPYSLPPSSKPRLLIVDDDETIRTQMKWALLETFEVFLAENRVEALDLFTRERPTVVTLDLGLPPRPAETEEGFLALSAIREVDPWAKVIVITGQDERENALKAIGEGAYDFFCKPIRLEELNVVLSRAFYLARLEREHRELRERAGTSSFEGMLGASPQMEGIFSSIRKVTTSDVPVLITGESGTGKELVARAIHRLGSRKEKPFVAINCGAIPETLLEAELFGHEKGAYTGAHIQRKGRFELADGGSLFLDEIGELSVPLQVKLLRFLQEQKIERIGGREEISVDVRVMAATNRDLKEAMKTGGFREDLYYRIGVVVIGLPPLREREGDVRVLATALLHRYAEENKRKISGFTPQALHGLEGYGWPGNIRELENRIRRAVIMAEGTKITPEDLELDPGYVRYGKKTLKDAREELEREYVIRALARSKGNMTQASVELGISRPTLYELIDKLKIEKEAK
jgi:two-component system, NtrC family, response regulator